MEKWKKRFVYVLGLKWWRITKPKCKKYQFKMWNAQQKTFEAGYHHLRLMLLKPKWLLPSKKMARFKKSNYFFLSRHLIPAQTHSNGGVNMKAIFPSWTPSAPWLATCFRSSQPVRHQSEYSVSLGHYSKRIERPWNLTTPTKLFLWILMKSF